MRSLPWRKTRWDPQGTQLIAMATRFRFDCTEVEDELRASWSPTARNDSRNGGGAPLLASGVRPPAARFLHRADTEEELRHIKMRTELYTSRKLLAEQEVQDANRNNHSEVREHARVGSVRYPPAPVVPPSVLAVLQGVQPVLATRQALQAHQQSATPPGTVLEEHVAQSDVEMRIALARRAQLERLTPRSGPTDNQAMVGQSEMATRKMESSTAEQGAEHALETHPVTRAQQSEEMSVEEAEAKAMKWLGVMQDIKTKKQQELEARAEARRLEDAESQAKQTKQLKEQAEALALQNEQAKKLEAHLEARSKAEQLTESVSLAEAGAKAEKRVMEEEFKAQADAQALQQRMAELQVQMRELEALADARAKKKAEAHTMKQLKEQAEERALQKEEAQAKQLTESAAHAKAEQLKEQLMKEQLRAVQMDESHATRLRQLEAQADTRALQREAEFQEQMREFEAQAEARATEKAEAHSKQMMQELAQAEAQATEKVEDQAVQMQELAQTEAVATEKEVEAQAMQMKELEAQTEATEKAEAEANSEGSSSGTEEGAPRAKRNHSE